jgi:general secretion pathway protein J
MRVSRKQSGFTLIEILVAVFIVGIISVVMLRGLQTAISTKNHLERNSIRLQNLEFSMSLLNSDIQNIVNQPIINNDGKELAAVWLHPDNSHMLEFTRGGVSNPLGAPRTTLLRIAYSLEDGKLTRTVWSTLDRTPETQAYTRVLMNGVSSLQWRFLSTTTNFAQNNWGEVWPSASLYGNMSLPRAIELTLKIPGWGDITRVFVVYANNPTRVPGQ